MNKLSVYRAKEVKRSLFSLVPRLWVKRLPLWEKKVSMVKVTKIEEEEKKGKDFEPSPGAVTSLSLAFTRLRKSGSFDALKEALAKTEDKKNITLRFSCGLQDQ